MAKTLGFDHHQIVAYHPASNGLCERTNQQVLSILRGLVDGKEHYWDLYLAEAQLALNTASHSAIGDTPYYVMFGRDAKTLAEWWTRPTTSYRLPSEDFVATHTQRSQKVYEYVRDNLLRAADRQGFREVHLENMKVALEATIPRALAPGARKPYPEMRPGEESVIPEGTREEEEDREMEYLVNYPRPVGVGAEPAHAMETQTSRLDYTNTTDSHNASANNAKDESRMNEGVNETHGRNVSTEHAGREPMHERRTSGRTQYGPGYYARLHEGPYSD
ncbi:uncharacterized protein LOC134769659 [Penaeus indicus]|uniref:uncharacterized protein LOC134769659 n=1 Tax=Penaeus indicus TaxID=29960 RepID=UPI00300C9723